MVAPVDDVEISAGRCISEEALRQMWTNEAETRVLDNVNSTPVKEHPMPARKYYEVPLSDGAKSAVKAWMTLRRVPYGKHITFGPDFMRIDDFSLELLKRSQNDGESLEDTTLRVVREQFSEHYRELARAFDPDTWRTI